MPSTTHVAGMVAGAALLAAMVPATPASSTPPTCFGEPATITGSGFVEGTPGPDVIRVTGASEVHAHGGDDLVCGAFLAYGGAGNDRIRYVGDMEGELSGGPGDDSLVWRSAAWADLAGGRGTDLLRANAGGAQSLVGGSGSDLLRGGAGDDMLSGMGGHDRILGGSGGDQIDGRGGNDLVFGGRGRDEMTGGPGTEDHGEGGPGADTCAGFESGSC